MFFIFYFLRSVLYIPNIKVKIIKTKHINNKDGVTLYL